MLFLMILLIFLTGCTTSRNAGSTLFYNRHPRTECWSEDDVAKLWARKHFEQIAPPSVNPDRVNIKYVKESLRYFRRALRSVEKDVDPHTATILKESLADTIGAHLRSDILPTVRFAYYAGYVPYRYARQAEDFFEEIKTILNTRGLGWQQPERIPKWTNLTVAKILIGAVHLFDPCAYLITKRDSNSCIHLPIPKLDNDQNPSAIALPFRFGGLVNLLTPDSENLLLKYYTTASRCILNSSPKNCRHADFVNFNNEMWHWMKREVAPHLSDEKLYAAYGGVLRIAAAVQNYGKGLSRRNLFDDEEVSLIKWHPLKTLSQSYVYINADLTPKFYIALVLIVVTIIILLQICYNYLCGDKNSCLCKRKPYSRAKSLYPAMVSNDSAVNDGVEKQINQSAFKTKASSSGSVKTQKVYDLNENTEKLMAVILSDTESEEESPLSKVDSDQESELDVGGSKRSRSPPKLETSISQLKLERKHLEHTLQMCSTSTVTHSDATYCQQQSESAWSATGSSTSGRSVSSTSTKSQSRWTRRSRDLAWARRVISKHSIVSRTKSTSGTELDLNSYTTPPSQR